MQINIYTALTPKLSAECISWSNLTSLTDLVKLTELPAAFNSSIESSWNWNEAKMIHTTIPMATMKWKPSHGEGHWAKWDSGHGHPQVVLDVGGAVQIPPVTYIAVRLPMKSPGEWGEPQRAAAVEMGQTMRNILLNPLLSNPSGVIIKVNLMKSWEDALLRLTPTKIGECGSVPAVDH